MAPPYVPRSHLLRRVSRRAPPSHLKPRQKNSIGVVACVAFLPGFDGFDRTLRKIFTSASACDSPSFGGPAPPLKYHSHLGWPMSCVPLNALYHNKNYTSICVGLCLALFLPLDFNLRMSLSFASAYVSPSSTRSQRSHKPCFYLNLCV